MHNVVLLGGGTVAFFWLLLMLADYGWERKKRRGFAPGPLPDRREQLRERTTYGWYSWVRYLIIILLTYINTVAVLNSGPDNHESFVSPLRVVSLFLIVILFSIALLIIDGYWDRRRGELMGSRKTLFFLYFWIRYPALIFATIQLTRRGFEA